MTGVEKNLCGATMVVVIDASHEDIQDFFNSPSAGAPVQLDKLKKELNDAYEMLVPFDFRYMAAFDEYELMGIFREYPDVVAATTRINDYLSQQGFDCFISTGFGSVCVPKDDERILHKVSGEGVYATFHVFKEAKKQGKMNKNRLPNRTPNRHFHSKRQSCSFLNDVESTTEEMATSQRRLLAHMQLRDEVGWD